MEFIPSFLKRHFTGKLGVTSQNVGCLLKLLTVLSEAWPYIVGTFEQLCSCMSSETSRWLLDLTIEENAESLYDKIS